MTYNKETMKESNIKKSMSTTTINKAEKAENSSSTRIEPISQIISLKKIALPEKQPRRYFNPTKMEHLTESIKRYGVLEPIIIRPLSSGNYELVAGERRFRAAKDIGLTEIPVIIRDLDAQQAFELALLENMQRDDLNPIDETEGLLELLCHRLGTSQKKIIQILNQAANAHKRGIDLTYDVTRQIEVIDQIFMAVGRLNRESFRTNRLPLLNLPQDVLKVLRQGTLDYTKAKAIAKLENIDQRQTLLQQTLEDKLSLAAIKKKIKQLQEKTQKGVGDNKPDVIQNQKQEVVQDDKNTISDVSTATDRDLRLELQSIVQFESNAWKNNRREIESLILSLKKALGI